MKKTLVILVSICAFWGCMKLDRPSVRFYEGAALVKEVTSENVFLKSLHDLWFKTPRLPGENHPEEGDLLWVNLLVEDDRQINEDTLIVSEIVYVKVATSLTKPTSLGSAPSEFDQPIERAVMWLNHAENFWIFMFEHIAPHGQTFDYEMLFEKKEGDVHPTVYIRARRTNTKKDFITEIVSYYGFDLTPLIEKYGNTQTNTLSFHVKFLSGFNTEGNEIFTSFQPSLVTVRTK